MQSLAEWKYIVFSGTRYYSVMIVYKVEIETAALNRN